MRHLLLTGLCLLSVPLTSTPSLAEAPDSLEIALEARGASPPGGFKAIVIALPPEGAEGRVYDWRGTAEVRRGWWPASTVKIFAALGALEVAEAHGFSPSARVGFGGSSKAVKLSWLVKKTLIHSHNRTFDRLGQIAGPEHTHAKVLTAARGLGQALLAEGYSYDISGYDLTWAPKVTFLEGRRRHTIPARRYTPRRGCGQRNCTSVGDLARALGLVMLHEWLPEGQRLKLSDDSVSLLRGALSDPARKRGLGAAKAIKRAFGHRRVKVWHKPGFYPSWRSDVLFVRAADTGERWLLGLAGRGGRGALDDISGHLGALMAEGKLPASGELSPVISQPPSGRAAER